MELRDSVLISGHASPGIFTPEPHGQKFKRTGCKVRDFIRNTTANKLIHSILEKIEKIEKFENTIENNEKKKHSNFSV